MGFLQDASASVDERKTALVELFVDRRALEPANVRAVHKPPILVAEDAVVEPGLDDAPVLRVWNAREDRRIGGEAGSNSTQHRPGIVKMLQHISESPATRWKQRVERVLAHMLPITTLEQCARATFA